MASLDTVQTKRAPPPLKRSESASSSTTIQASNRNGSLDTGSSLTSLPTTSTSLQHERKPSSPKKSSIAQQVDDPLRSHPFFDPRTANSTRSREWSTHSQERHRNASSRPSSPHASQSSSHLDSPSGTPRITERRKWADRYTTLGDYGDESVVDENAPMSKASHNEDEEEEKRIQQNLESWAAREKQKRKEHRARVSGGNTSPSTSKFAKRLSLLGTAATSSKSPATGQNRHSMGPGSHLYESAQRPSLGSFESYVSSNRTRVDGAISRKSSAGTTPGLELEEQGDYGVYADETLTPDKDATKGKGKAREASDPFKDPQAQANGSPYGYTSQPRIKPRPGMPIVTPGRAPTIRHRAIEHAEKTGRYNQAPTIIATDVEEEGHVRRVASNPFRTPDGRLDEQEKPDAEQDITQGDVRQPRPRSQVYPLGTTIVDGARATPEEKAQNRKSTSSRFNEVGLDDEDDADGWPEDAEHGKDSAKSYGYGHNWRDANGGPNMRKGRKDDTQGEAQPAHERRKPWWSEWLCGIGAPRDDEEQSGRTFPE